MAAQPYTVAELQTIIAAMKAAHDDPGVAPPGIDQQRMFRTILEAIRNILQRLQNAGIP